MDSSREALCRSLGFESPLALHNFVVKAIQGDIGALARRGLDEATLRALGYTSEGLRRLGCTDAQLEQIRPAEPAPAAQPTPAALKAPSALSEGEVAAIQDLLAKGLSCAELKERGITAHHCRTAGAGVTQLLRLGFPMGELVHVYTLHELKRAGHTVLDLSPYFSDAELKAAGYSAGEMRLAGRTVQQLLRLGYNENHIRTAGYSVNELVQAGLSKLTRDFVKGQ